MNRVAEHYHLTSIGVNPSEDRAHRMHVYFIAMSVRIACVASLFFVRGWWILVVGLAAVILPYFAVIFANERSTAAGDRPEAPTPRELLGTEPTAQDSGEEEHPAETVLIVDAPAERRSTEQRPAQTHSADEVHPAENIVDAPDEEPGENPGVEPNEKRDAEPNEEPGGGVAE